MNEERRELLNRKYVGGTTVTNCLIHSDSQYTARPDSCKLCLSDLRNVFSQAVGVNEWLNKWKDDATKLLEAVEQFK